MIGPQPTGTLPEVEVTYSPTEGLRATWRGEPVLLAIVTPEHLVMADGPTVAREVEAAVINGYRNMLQGKGALRERLM